jgi:hypothetical protein
MKLQIRVDENGVIQEAKFKTFGCGSAIASSSYMTELVTGRTLEEASKIKNTEIAKELCLPPVKLHCSSECYFQVWPTCNGTADVLVSACRGRHSLSHPRLSHKAQSSVAITGCIHCCCSSSHDSIGQH